MLKTDKIATILATLLITACGSGVTEIIPPVLPHNPVDEGWKVLANYEHAYNTKDADLLAATLDTQFIHLLPPNLWDDFDGDGMIDSTWSYVLELDFAQLLFSNCEAIEFYFSGDASNTWFGDPSGESLIYPRDYYMQVYYSSPDSGFIATGIYELICKPDTNNIWHLTHLIEQ